MDKFSGDLQDHYIKLSKKQIGRLYNQYKVGLATNDTQFVGYYSKKSTKFMTMITSHYLLLNAIIKSNLGSDHSIQVFSKPIPQLDPYESKLNKNDLSIQLIDIMSFTIPLISCAFIIFYVKERVSKAKLLQYVSGLNATTLWLTSFLFDIFVYILIIVIAMIPVIVYRNEVWSSPEEMFALFVVHLLYGFSILAMCFVLSFLFNGPTSATIWNVVLFIIPRK